ncbi:MULTISPECIES: hypothetical protein [unclassified Chryseobacterium]|uniref:hypothetical protein n=1 Tax=unclassified Chryseobacterium TaxID=2593645 RepID=UPI000D3B0948|nr:MULTISPECIES: hypothetical protein [unclassified Chryseobacterium]PTT68274.1 hypothetical protein DBR25_20250 [Chryseobacterium sp. HMWF001]PVV61086.1 hypothetical protein DD829_03195 [Chryseobacterium sp. HMWF035]
MKFKEKNIQISMVIITLVMTILRFLLNEKGRVNPDSIRYMRFAHVFPTIDNTTTPLGYPLAIKFFTFFGFDEFWGSKIVGVSAFLFIIYFTWKKKFFFRESVVLCALFSFLSIFSYTMSEPLILPFVMVFLYVSTLIIEGKLEKGKAVFYLSLSLIALYNIRYSALFIMGGTGLFGLIFWKRKYSGIFIISGIIGGIFVVLYKFLFIDYFNENYVSQFLEIGLHPTSKLLAELFQGLCTTFNPFIHIADPGGGMINYAIYGIGFLNILLIVFLFIKYKLSETEAFYIFVSVFGMICSYFIQYFYSVNAIDYRLMAPFSLPVWLVYFRKLFMVFEVKTYALSFLSLLSGMLFTWLSKGNYLENRKEMRQFLQSEKMEKIPLKFYLETAEDLDKIQVAELMSTINPNITLTFKPKDTLQKTTLTRYKVLQKIKIDKNKYQ